MCVRELRGNVYVLRTIEEEEEEEEEEGEDDEGRRGGQGRIWTEK